MCTLDTNDRDFLWQELAGFTLCWRGCKLEVLREACQSWTVVESGVRTRCVMRRPKRLGLGEGAAQIKCKYRHKKRLLLNERTDVCVVTLANIRVLVRAALFLACPDAESRGSTCGGGKRRARKIEEKEKE